MIVQPLESLFAIYKMLHDVNNIPSSKRCIFIQFALNVCNIYNNIFVRELIQSHINLMSRKTNYHYSFLVSVNCTDNWYWCFYFRYRLSLFLMKDTFQHIFLAIFCYNYSKNELYISVSVRNGSDIINKWWFIHAG